MVPSADLKAKLLAQVAQTPALTRAAQQRLSRAVLLAVAAAVAVEFLAEGGVKTGSRPVGFVGLTSAAWALSSAALIAGLNARPPLGLSAVGLWALVVGSLALPFGAGLVGNALYPATAVPVAGHPGLYCLELGLALATLPLTGLIFVRRESDPLHPVSLGAAIGALAACISGLLVNLACGYTNPAHVGLGHIFPALIEVGVGALLGGLLIAVRGQSAPRRTWAALGAALGGWAASLFNVSIQRACPTRIEPQQLLAMAAAIAIGAVVGSLLSPRHRPGS